MGLRSILGGGKEEVHNWNQKKKYSNQNLSNLHIPTQEVFETSIIEMLNALSDFKIG